MITQRAFGARSLPWDRLRRFPCDLVVNATSVGLAPDCESTPAPISWITAPWVYDIIYNPRETPLIEAARQRGNRTVTGLGMLLHQGIPAWKAWFGIEPKVTAELRAKIEATL